MATINVPPDPDKQNDDRSNWARRSLECFMRLTRTDLEDAVSDFLCDLAHYCDRRNIQLGCELRRAELHYVEESGGEGVQEFTSGTQ